MWVKFWPSPPLVSVYGLFSCAHFKGPDGARSARSETLGRMRASPYVPANLRVSTMACLRNSATTRTHHRHPESRPRRAPDEAPLLALLRAPGVAFQAPQEAQARALRQALAAAADGREGASESRSPSTDGLCQPMALENQRKGLPHWLSGWPKKRKNLIFTTKMVFPKSLKLMNSGSELQHEICSHILKPGILWS